MYVISDRVSPVCHLSSFGILIAQLGKNECYMFLRFIVHIELSYIIVHSQNPSQLSNGSKSHRQSNYLTIVPRLRLCTMATDSKLGVYRRNSW